MRHLLGFLFGAGISWFNFFLLKKWAIRLGKIQRRISPFYAVFTLRYLVLFFGIFFIVSGRWVDRWAGLLGLFGMYVGLLAYEFVKLKRMGG